MVSLTENYRIVKSTEERWKEAANLSHESCLLEGKTEKKSRKPINQGNCSKTETRQKCTIYVIFSSSSPAALEIGTPRE